MSKVTAIYAFQVQVDGRVIRTIQCGSYEHADPVEREKAARAEATLQMQRWFGSEQFIGRKLTVEALRQ